MASPSEKKIPQIALQATNFQKALYRTSFFSDIFQLDFLRGRAPTRATMFWFLIDAVLNLSTGKPRLVLVTCLHAYVIFYSWLTFDALHCDISRWEKKLLESKIHLFTCFIGPQFFKDCDGKRLYWNQSDTLPESERHQKLNGYF